MGISKFTDNFADRANPTILDNFTTKRAASSRLSTGKIFIAAEAIKTLASSTLVP